MIFLSIVIFVLGAAMIVCDNEKVNFIGCAFTILGALLFLLCFKPIKTETGEYEQELNKVPIAGVTKELNVTLPTDYHYEWPKAEVEDVDLLARLITAEQGYGAGEDAYYYTASVVWNRMNSNSFPTDLRDVIYQEGQYQCVKNGHINRDYDDLAWEVAVAVLEEGTWIPENVVYQAEFVQGSGVWEQVGRTYFCYE